MRVLEKWVHRGYPHRLVVTDEGDLRAEFQYPIGPDGPYWMRCHNETHLRLFAPAKKQRRPK